MDYVCIEPGVAGVESWGGKSTPKLGILRGEDGEGLLNLWDVPGISLQKRGKGNVHKKSEAAGFLFDQFMKGSQRDVR